MSKVAAGAPKRAEKVEEEAIFSLKIAADLVKMTADLGKVAAGLGKLPDDLANSRVT